ncbi:tripartite tricarboxylate transporter TctB family protein [Desulfovibrio sp. OttesenSCG-928-O18]|nr:tripartite tricarboxylate transporter TctB family protein [Desulfovibrio sp. OttesenSCG-928-O18]
MSNKQGIIIHQDVYISAVLIAAGLYLFSEANGMMKQAARFPKLCLVAFLFFMAIVLVQGIKKSMAATREGNAEGTRLLQWNVGKMPYAVFAISSVYVFLIMVIGFFPATALYSPALMLFFKCFSWKRIALVAVGNVVFVYLIFVKILGATLP